MNEAEIIANAKSLGILAKQLSEWQKKLEKMAANLEDREDTLKRSYQECLRLKEQYGRRNQ
jgi:hypothetical protein